jgi:coproporphyrinogen III oxidase-like Fe-S oxidoreductase
MTSKSLLEKYNTPVPRYTSYPPANFFTEAFTAADYLKAVEESNKWAPQNISLYFHIPFCLKMCYFCGCNSYAIRKDEVVDAYMKHGPGGLNLFRSTWIKAGRSPRYIMAAVLPMPFRPVT